MPPLVFLNVCKVVFPIQGVDTFPDPQWIPKTMDSTEPYTYSVLTGQADAAFLLGLVMSITRDNVNEGHNEALSCPSLHSKCIQCQLYSGLHEGKTMKKTQPALKSSQGQFEQ